MGISILSYCLHFHFRRHGSFNGKIIPTATYTLVENNNNMQISLVRAGHTGWAKKMNKPFSYNSVCLAVIIRLLFNTLEAL